MLSLVRLHGSRDFGPPLMISLLGVPNLATKLEPMKQVTVVDWWLLVAKTTAKRVANLNAVVV